MKLLMAFNLFVVKSRSLGPTFTPSTTVSSTHKSLVAREETVNDEDMERRNRVLIATVRVLCSWLAEETSASRDEVCALAPFLLAVATDSHAQAKAEKIKALPPSSDRSGDSECN